MDVLDGALQRDCACGFGSGSGSGEGSSTGSGLLFLQHVTAAIRTNRCRTRRRILFLKELKDRMNRININEAYKISAMAVVSGLGGASIYTYKIC